MSRMTRIIGYLLLAIVVFGGIAKAQGILFNESADVKKEKNSEDGEK